MPDSTSQSDQIMQAATQSLATQRAGGTHRPGTGKSIGKGSAGLRSKNFWTKVRNVVLAVFAIWMGAGIAGAMFSGIGFWGVMGVVVATAIAVALFSSFPKVKIPTRNELKKGNPRQMVARVELWLEAQRDGLPAQAVSIIDHMGLQLDALGIQLETMEDNHPAMTEVRELVGEYIPETIDNYRKIPAHLRQEEHAGGTADERLVTSLTKISGELDRVTHRLAEGALDDLAIKSRYLDYRYGGDELLEDLTNSPDTGVPLPDFSASPAKQKR